MAAGTDLSPPVAAVIDPAVGRETCREVILVESFDDQLEMVTEGYPEVIVLENSDRDFPKGSSFSEPSTPLGEDRATAPWRPPKVLAAAAAVRKSAGCSVDGEEAVEIEDDAFRIPKEILEAPSFIFVPSIRSGAFEDIGGRKSMEDAHILLDDISSCSKRLADMRSSFFGVFDGHGGQSAAAFARRCLLENLLKQHAFPGNIHEALRCAFLQTDQEFRQACTAGSEADSGTTALTALVVGRTLLVANAGDCRAVLSQRGKAIELSRDHKPCCAIERTRIVDCGGFVEDGYLSGQLGVARAIGNWHMEDLKVKGQLTCVPEVREWELTADDEFLLLACDGLWDVMSSAGAVQTARKRLMQHNDPQLCARELVEEALRRGTTDNVSIVVVCFQDKAPRRLSDPSRVKRSISMDGLKLLQGKLDAT